MTKIADIEKLVAEYSSERKTLSDNIKKYKKEVLALNDKHAPLLESQLKKVAKLRAKVSAFIDNNRDLFQKPKTKTAHEIRFGLKKEKGKVIIEDDEQTLNLIKKNCPEMEDDLIAVTEKPKKTALQDLPGKLLKKLGVKLTDDTDVVYIKAAETDIDKFLDVIADPNVNIKELL